MSASFSQLIYGSLLGCLLLNSAAAQSPPPTWTMAHADAGASGAVSHTLPQNLQVLWETKTAEAIESTPVSDGVRIFLTDVMGGVEALDVQNGESQWRREFETGFVAPAGLYLPSSLGPAASATTAPLAVIAVRDAVAVETTATATAQALLVVGDVEGNIEAIAPETGESLWKFTTEGQINAAPAFFAAQLPEQEQSVATAKPRYEIRLLQASQDGSLYCLNAHTGELRWKYETGDQIRCAASIGGGKTFIGGCDGALHVVDLATGQAAREPIPLGGPTGSTPAIAGEEAFLPIMDGVVFAFDLVSGENRWKFEDPDRLQEYRSNVAIAADRIIVSSNNKHVDAISRKTGQRLWRKTLRRRADASPLIAGRDVWIAASDGRLLRLSLADGEETWSFETRGRFMAAPAILGDRLIIADDRGVVRCFAAAKAN